MLRYVYDIRYYLDVYVYCISDYVYGVSQNRVCVNPDTQPDVGGPKVKPCPLSRDSSRKEGRGKGAFKCLLALLTTFAPRAEVTW